MAKILKKISENYAVFHCKRNSGMVAPPVMTESHDLLEIILTISAEKVQHFSPYCIVQRILQQNIKAKAL